MVIRPLPSPLSPAPMCLHGLVLNEARVQLGFHFIVKYFISVNKSSDQLRLSEEDEVFLYAVNKKGRKYEECGLDATRHEKKHAAHYMVLFGECQNPFLPESHSSLIHILSTAQNTVHRPEENPTRKAMNAHARMTSCKQSLPSIEALYSASVSSLPRTAPEVLTTSKGFYSVRWTVTNHTRFAIHYQNQLLSTFNPPGWRDNFGNSQPVVPTSGRYYGFENPWNMLYPNMQQTVLLCRSLTRKL